MSFLLLNWRMVAIGILSVLVTLFYNLWRSEHDALVSFRSSIAATAAAAEAENARMLRVQLANLNVLKVDYEAKLPTVRADAIAAYLRRMPKPTASGGQMPRASAGIKLDAGASQECGFDSALVQDAADDAQKLSAWIRYGQMNHLPVKD